MYLVRHMRGTASELGLRRVIGGSNNFLRICNSFLDLINSSTVIFEKTFDLKHFLGFAKYFWIVPFRLPQISYLCEHPPVAILGSHSIVLGRARPESHDSWVALPDGLNGSVSDPGAVDSRKRRPPAGVTMNGTTTLTSTVKRLQLGVCHVPVHRHKFMFTQHGRTKLQIKKMQ